MSLEIDAIHEIMDEQKKRIDNLAYLLDTTQQRLNILLSEFDRHTGFTHTEPILY